MSSLLEKRTTQDLLVNETETSTSKGKGIGKDPVPFPLPVGGKRNGGETHEQMSGYLMGVPLMSSFVN